MGCATILTLFTPTRTKSCQLPFYFLMHNWFLISTPWSALDSKYGIICHVLSSARVTRAAVEAGPRRRRILGHQQLFKVIMLNEQINCPFSDVTGARAGVVTAMRLAIVQTIPGIPEICTILNSHKLSWDRNLAKRKAIQLAQWTVNKIDLETQRC